MTAAFEGIKILDFTQVLAGPFAVMQLALLGAEVIKVEQPETGDQTRTLMNQGPDLGMSPSFMGMNLNKKSLTLNLREPEAAEVIRRLLPTVDVVVENFRAGTMQRRGLDYETLRELKPDLIYCSISGYGQTGSRAGQAAYDGAIQASSGMMSQNGHEKTGPTRTGYMPVDMSTALNTAFAISASLHRKARTGEGQYIDVAMQDTAVVMQAVQFNNYINQGQLVGLQGNASPTGQPTANVFPTKDGHIQITALRQPQVEKLFNELGLSDLLKDENFATPDARLRQQAPVFEAIAKALAHQTTGDWMRQLTRQGIPVAEVRGLPEVASDTDLENRGVFVSLPSPLDAKETIRVVRAGYVTNKDGPHVRSGPPILGAHTEVILRDIGYDDEQINQLANKGVI